MLKTILKLSLASIASLLISAHLSAESLSIQSVAQSSSKASSSKRPQRGMSMHKVRELFGNPEKEQAPVGQNKKRRMHHAITRWQYDDFTVVFAEKSVIDTVTLKVNK